MTKELQDHVWKHCLPKEFKEGVKSLYEKFYNEKPHSDCSYGYLGLLIKLFGIYNLTSDAEGEEELLTVPRKDVVELYQECQKTISQCKGTELAGQSIGIRNVIWSFFGSKCLPDEAMDDTMDDTKESNVDSSHGNVDSLEQKPPEPKYKVGEKVECLRNHHIYVIRHLDFDDGIWWYNYGNPAIWIKESDLKPYTEPQENVNLSQETANCDKQFDRILKDSFSKERRLNIAAQFMSAMMSNPSVFHSRLNSEEEDFIIYGSLEFADTLIAEALKGGRNGED